MHVEGIFGSNRGQKTRLLQIGFRFHFSLSLDFNFLFGLLLGGSNVPRFCSLFPLFLVVERNPMEAEGETQWSSLLVPSVLEIVKEKNFTTVPLRYLRSDQDKTETSDDSRLSSKIPAIDMQRLCSVSSMDTELKKLDLACQDWGFFQVKSL